MKVVSLCVTFYEDLLRYWNLLPGVSAELPHSLHVVSQVDEEFVRLLLLVLHIILCLLP